MTTPPPEQPQEPGPSGSGQYGSGQYGSGQYGAAQYGQHFGAQYGAQGGWGQGGWNQGGWGQPWPGASYARRRTNGKATASLVVGIGSIVLSWCCGLGVVGIVAIVLGAMARNEIRRGGGQEDGDGFALGGIITGAVGLLLSLVILVLVGLAIAGAGGFAPPGDPGGAQHTDV
jgi:hypothetical protein